MSSDRKFCVIENIGLEILGIMIRVRQSLGYPIKYLNKQFKVDLMLYFNLFIILLLPILFNSSLCSNVVKLEINNDFQETRQFHYLKPKISENKIFKCLLKYKKDNNEYSIPGEELKRNKIFEFKDIPKGFEFIKDAELLIELPAHEILDDLELEAKNQVIKTFSG